MSGHGHVTPNADGARARCGGPGICHVCNAEFVALHYKPPLRPETFEEKRDRLLAEMVAEREKNIGDALSGNITFSKVHEIALLLADHVRMGPKA